MVKRLATVGMRIGSFDARRVKPPPKVAKDIYHTTEYTTWRETVITRAGGRCEAIDNGKRCWKGQRHGHRVFADHKVELTDGGAPFDPANGECLCGSHHTLKTARARADRR